MFNIKSYKNLCFNILVFIIIGFGIFLRASLYFKQIPFWHDELLLGLNFFDNNLSKFFFSLSNILKIPPLWGIINQIFINIFGPSFLAFRFIPFVSGISALIAFFFLLKNLFKDKIAILIGLLLFSLNPCIIYYSNEFKPYSSDVLVCILLLLSFKFISLKNISFRKIILYTLISMAIILFSFPAMFIIPAIILAKCIEEKHFNPKILLIFMGVCSACLYLYFIDRECYKFMVQYWGSDIYLSGFLEPSFGSFNLLINNFFNYIFSGVTNSDYFNIKYFVLVSLIFFFIHKQKEAFIFLFIILFTLLASFLKVYPFSQRVSLYLIPIILILIAKLIDFSYSLTKEKILIFKSVLIAGLILFLVPHYNKFSFSIEKFSNLIKPENQREDFYYYSKNIMSKANNEDIIIVPHSIEVLLRFYNNYLSENKKLNIIMYDCPEDNKEVTERQLLKKILDNYDHSINIWISGKYRDCWDISSDNINIVEDELKKHNLKYTKTDDGVIYTFKVDR